MRAKQILGKVANGGDPVTEKAHERDAPKVGELADLIIKQHADKKLKASTPGYYRLLSKRS